MKLVLASTSPFRKALLEKLQLPFVCDKPEIDETPLPGEHIEAMVRRLSLEKARACAANHPDALIIGSDQSAVLGGEKLGKPGDFDTAMAQLRAASGQAVTFYTGLCLLNSQSGKHQIDCVTCKVIFRQLDDATIRAYLEKEQPFNCAGSFKSEALGIALFERFEGDDPNALIGLPLIRLCTFLQNAGMPVLSIAHTHNR